jgi:hypothetical protein
MWRVQKRSRTLLTRELGKKPSHDQLQLNPACRPPTQPHRLRRLEIDPGYVAVTLERLAAIGLKPELIP